MFHVKQGWALGLQGFSQMGYLSTVRRPWGLQQSADWPAIRPSVAGCPFGAPSLLGATTKARSGTGQAFLRHAIR